MKIPYNFKKIFPNLLTGFRLLIAPILILLGLFGKVVMVLILTILACLTDLFDGFFARKWDVSTQFGAKLDAISDKVFAASLLISLTKETTSLWILVLFEICIALCNLYFYTQLKQAKTLMIGKIKTTSLFVCIVCAFLEHFFHTFSFILRGLIYVTINLQILTGIHYILHYIKKVEKLTLEDAEVHQKIMKKERLKK